MDGEIGLPGDKHKAKKACEQCHGGGRLCSEPKVIRGRVVDVIPPPEKLAEELGGKSPYLSTKVE